MDITPASVHLSSKNPRLILTDLNGQTLVPDLYRVLLRASGDAPLMSIGGAVVDGDADGNPGGDFKAQFTLIEE